MPPRFSVVPDARFLKMPPVPDVPAQGGRQVLTYGGFAQDRVFLHPASFNFSVGEWRCPWLVYSEKAETTPGKVCIRDTTMVSPYALLLFGGCLTVEHAKSLLCVGARKWTRFHAEARIGVLVKGLRGCVAAVLKEKIACPALDVSTHPVIECVTSLLISRGGAGGLS